MTEFELWIKACEEYGTCIYPLGGYGDTAIYKTYKCVIFWMVGHDLIYHTSMLDDTDRRI